MKMREFSINPTTRVFNKSCLNRNYSKCMYSGNTKIYFMKVFEFKHSTFLQLLVVIVHWFSQIFLSIINRRRFGLLCKGI